MRRPSVCPFDDPCDGSRTEFMGDETFIYQEDSDDDEEETLKTPGSDACLVNTRSKWCTYTSVMGFLTNQILLFFRSVSQHNLRW